MNQPEKETAGSELETLRREVTRLSEELAGMKEVAEPEPTTSKDQLFDELKSLLDRSRKDGKKAMDEVGKIGETIEQRPLLSVLLALLMGMLLGKLFGGGRS